MRTKYQFFHFEALAKNPNLWQIKLHTKGSAVLEKMNAINEPCCKCYLNIKKKSALINGMKRKCRRKLDIKYPDDVLFNFV